MKTYTEDELKAAVAAAVAALEARVTELQKADADEELAVKIAEAEAAAKAPLEAEVAELKTTLEETKLNLEAEKARADGIVTWLEGEAAAQAEADAATARRDDRIAQAKEAAPFLTDEFVEENAAEWAAASDEAFEKTLGFMRAAAAQAGTTTKVATTTLPEKTALQTSRETTSGIETSAAKALIGLATEGIDVRKIPETRGV